MPRPLSDASCRAHKMTTQHRPDGQTRLKRKNTVAEGGDLLVRSKPMDGVADPTIRQAHQPLNERR